MIHKWTCLVVTLTLHMRFCLSAIYITDMGSKKILELSGMGEPCKMMSDRSTISNMIKRVDSRYIQRLQAQDLDDLAQRCRDIEGVHKRGGFLYPGTKWCGPGNSAQGYSDLGVKTAEDQCCREHDHCTNVLEPGQCRQSICNVSPFTRSHCDCDNAFKRCLHHVNTNAANTIGVLYFNVAQLTCFKERRDCPPFMRNCNMEFVPMSSYDSVEPSYNHYNSNSQPHYPQESFPNAVRSFFSNFLKFR